VLVLTLAGVAPCLGQGRAPSLFDFGTWGHRGWSAQDATLGSYTTLWGPNGLPLPLLAKVLQRLARQGLLESTYGTNGGYRLARDPRHISALEVIRAIDGPTILTTCSTRGGDCHQAGRCSVRAPLSKIQHRILEVLNSITISEMRDEPARFEVLNAR